MQKLTTVFVFLFLVGCAGKQNMEISKDVFDKPSSIVIAQTLGLESPRFKFGVDNQPTVGLIAAFIQDWTMEGTKQVALADAKPIVEEYYYRLFMTSLEKKGLKIIRHMPVLDKSKLSKSSLADDNHTSFDFRFLREEHSAEYALILDPEYFGAIRPGLFYNPRGVTTLSIYLVRTQDNKIAGCYNASVTIKADDDWDKTPEHTGLVEVTQHALKEALKEAHAYFFNGGLKGIETQK
jgi:uncharacterized protein YcfL